MSAMLKSNILEDYYDCKTVDDVMFLVKHRPMDAVDCILNMQNEIEMYQDSLNKHAKIADEGLKTILDFMANGSPLFPKPNN